MNPTAMYTFEFTLRNQNARGMNNLSSMTAILAGLHSPHVFRLRGSWKLVSKGKVDDMISCLHTSDVRDRFLNPFVTLACLEPPGVPFIGNTFDPLAEARTI